MVSKNMQRSMSIPAEKLGQNLTEAVATLEQLIKQFNLEKEQLEAEKNEEIEALRLMLEAESAKLRATRLAFESGADKSNTSEDGCHMIPAIDLTIVSNEMEEYWAWTTVPESRHAVAELLSIHELHICGHLAMEKLSPQTKYGSYLVYKFTEDSSGFDVTPGEAYAGILGEEFTLRTIYLIPEEDQAGSDRADWYPVIRPDGWMEVELGEFFINEIDTFGEVEMNFQELFGELKSGLIVQGIEVRRK